MLLREHPPTLIAKRISPEAATSLHAAVAIVIISGVPPLQRAINFTSEEP